MFRWPGKAALALCACAALVAQEGSTIRVNVNLVHAVATVKNAAGQIVGTLGKDDFEIYDNGVPHKIAVFEHQTEQKLSVALLIDISGSTAKDLAYEADAASRFLHALLAEGNPADAVKLYSFNWQVWEGTSTFTRDIKTLS